MASPGRQKSECEFCLFGVFFCARRAAPCAGLAVLARPAAVMRAFCARCLFACRAFCARSSVLFWLSVCLFYVVCTRIFLLSFAFSCLAFCLSNFFSFVAHAATGTPFSFRKENGGKEPRGERRAAPLRTPFLRPAANLPFSLAAGRLKRPFGRKPPAGGETLEKPGSRAQLFKRFCAKGDACALWLISPFLSLLAGLAALRAATAG